MEVDPPEQQRRSPAPWFIKLLSLQSDIISDCLLSLTSPFLSLLSLTTSTSLHREEPKETLNSVTPAAPSMAMHGSSILLRKAVLGFVGAAYVCLVLMTVMVVSVVVGAGLVNFWVEEPVYIKENLYFDYTDVHPYAVLDFGFHLPDKILKNVPVGHICHVRLVFVMPESDYNQEIGMFQVVAEALSADGKVITSASQPCMLQFRSQPIRLVQTFLMGVPLLLGITSEIQTVNVPLLKYREPFYPRTQSIRLAFMPRAGTPFLPQLYEAKVIVTSKLPWQKELVRNWKWAFYVWTSLYIYLMLLVVMICCFRSILFPAITTDQRVSVLDVSAEEPEPVPRVIDGINRPVVSETLKRWRQSRNKRKAMVLGGGIPETSPESDATSMSVTRDEDTGMATQEVGDSESVCQ